MGRVTLLLRAWHEGDRQALDWLTPLIYPELHRVAQFCMARERSGHMLQNTALINEAYLKLLGLRHLCWQNRTHFYAVAARLMRQILTDYARSEQALKRGGEMQRVDFDGALELQRAGNSDLVAIDDALRALAKRDSRKVKVVEMHFYGGLSFDEIAGLLNIAEVTVRRDWKFAKLWLRRELARS